MSVDTAVFIQQNKNPDECYLLATLMLFGEGIEKCEKLDSRHFETSEHQTIWQTIRTLYDEGAEYTLDCVHIRLQREGEIGALTGKYLLDLTEAWGWSTAGLQCEVAELVNKRLLREVGSTANRIAVESTEGTEAGALIEEAQREFLLLQSQRETRSEASMAQVVRETMRAHQARHQAGGLVGLAMGYDGLDTALGGLLAGALYILAARPAMGKTAFALNIALNIALRKKPVAMFSLEMSANELGGRLLSATSRVAMDKPFKMLNAADHARIARATDTLREAPITVVDSSMLTAVELRGHARKLHAQGKCALLVVDYLQLMTGSAESREREIGEISRSLKLVAKELSIPVLALSQLNRGVESRTEKRPTLSDLRDSGSIEQDADAVMFLYRDEVYNEKSNERGIAEVIVAKNRHGATTKARLRFDAPTQRFDELAPS